MQEEPRRGCNVFAAVVRSGTTERVIAWHLPTRYEAEATTVAQTLEMREGKLVAVVYETVTYRSGSSRFSVCKPVLATLHLQTGPVFVVVEQVAPEKKLFEGAVTLSSGVEVAGGLIREAVPPETRIRVTVSRPERPYHFSLAERPIESDARQHDGWREAVGTRYRSRREIAHRYGGQLQGGISTPANSPFVLLFAGESGERYGYADGWNDAGVFLYTGEGQIGDMTFSRGNLAVRDHASAGKTLRLFTSLGRGQGYRYDGEFGCASWEYRDGIDREGTTRRGIVFGLVPLASNSTLGDEDTGSDVPPGGPVTLEELRHRALRASRVVPESRVAEGKRSYQQRSADVRAYVLARSLGRCEACGALAPFERRDGSLYLEPHHVELISEGGPDDPHWVGAVCPNCHREFHYGVHGETRNATLRAKLQTIEPD
jgi:5-methylcytosine-specific restriction protein A